MIRARLKRWWYLLTSGMYRGECAVNIWDKDGVRLIGSGIPLAEGVFSNYRIFWERK